MQKLFSQCYDLDRRCYEQFGLSEEILMEHAAEAMAQHLKKRLAPHSHLLIVAGPGNNGADGIALARQLHGAYHIMLYLPYGAKSTMAQKQLQRALAVGVAPITSVPNKADAIVDALFGAGLHKPLDQTATALIAQLNAMEGYKVACDLPTGLDSLGNPLPSAFRADTTITMGALKVALFSDHAKPYVGAIEVADLGIARTLYETKSDLFVLDSEDFSGPLRTDPSAHKGHFGHLGIIVGAKRGAAILCASAALRFGAGLVTLCTKRYIESLPHSLMQSDQLPSSVTAIALGMGLGEGFDITKTLQTIRAHNLPLLLDADACYAPWLKELLQAAPQAILTPHPKEFVALLKNLGIADTDVDHIQSDRFGWARQFSMTYPHATLLLKGANTLIAHEKMLYVNPLGTPVLSQAGSGDMLAGLIGSLLAQGYPPLQAAIQGSLAQTLCARRYQGANYTATAEALIEELAWLE